MVQGHYPTEYGHSTEDAQKDWVRMYQPKADPDKSLVNNDPDSPLYFWQLYSILGPERITAVLTSFYTRIYDDKDAPWFTNVFKIRSKEHHIRVNAQFWCDAMGGGKQFYGGDQRYGSSADRILLNDPGAITLCGFERCFGDRQDDHAMPYPIGCSHALCAPAAYTPNARLNYFHSANARDIMTADGAERWMHHMKLALMDQHFDNLDPRINPCIMQFLKVKMGKYAQRYNWKLDTSDFRLPSKMCILQ